MPVRTYQKNMDTMFTDPFFSSSMGGRIWLAQEQPVRGVDGFSTRNCTMLDIGTTTYDIWIVTQDVATGLFSDQFSDTDVPIATLISDLKAIPANSVVMEISDTDKTNILAMWGFPE